VVTIALEAKKILKKVRKLLSLGGKGRVKLLENMTRRPLRLLPRTAKVKAAAAMRRMKNMRASRPQTNVKWRSLRVGEREGKRVLAHLVELVELHVVAAEGGRVEVSFGIEEQETTQV
jgi:hypothetical protein